MGNSNTTGKKSDLTKAAIAKVVNDLWAQVDESSIDPNAEVIPPDQDIFSLERHKCTVRSWPALTEIGTGANGQHGYFFRKAQEDYRTPTNVTPARPRPENKHGSVNSLKNLMSSPVPGNEANNDTEAQPQVKGFHELYILHCHPEAHTDRILFVEKGSVDFTAAARKSHSSNGTGSPSVLNFKP